jgi:hypothetical protein
MFVYVRQMDGKPEFVSLKAPKKTQKFGHY